METYQIFVVPEGNTRTMEEPELQARNDPVTPNIKGVKARDDFDDEEAINNS